MAGRGKDEEGYSVEAQENMEVALEAFKESLIPIGSEEANKNVFATIKVMIGGIRRRLVDLGNVDAPEGPLKIQLMIFNKEHIPLVMEQLKEDGFKPRAEPGSQYVKIDVPPPTRLQLMDIAADVDRRTKSCIGALTKIKSNTSQRLMKALDNEYIEQKIAGIANKNMEKTFTKLEKESVKIGMLKKIDILGKWFSPETDLEKTLYKTYKEAEAKKAKKSESKSD
ncbi:ribosome recycling factor [Alphaproteobacteria bacterium]|nr:ribosome recycling factor [Alphaproteobacteria bacterium]